MVFRTSLAICGVLAAPGVALAAHSAGNAEAAAFTNEYSTMLERQLFSWHIWTTGVSRLDDGALFGLTAVVLLLAFGVSGVGIIVFKGKGLGFRAGWLISLPIILASIVAYCIYRPYPTQQDLPSLLIFSSLAALGVLFVGRMVKGSITGDIEFETPKAAAQPKGVNDRRLKMAVRAQTASREN